MRSDISNAIFVTPSTIVKLEDELASMVEISILPGSDDDDDDGGCTMSGTGFQSDPG